MGARLSASRPLFECLARLSAATLLAALSACSGDQSAAPTTSPPSAADRGAQIYATNCIACHQADGHGIPKVYPSLAGSAVVNGDAGELARWVIRGQRPAAMATGRFTTVMPHYGWLKPEDAAALLTHVRASFGNRAAAVSGADITQALQSP